MGCSDNRDKFTPEEFAIIKEESNLGYSNLHIRQIVMVTKRYGAARKMNHAQFIEYTRLLKLKASEITNPSCKIATFYEMYAKNGLFDQDQLVVLGLLCGKGTTEERAGVFFDFIDD
jgi:hypothetical protein